jgi:hypothetical protein
MELSHSPTECKKKRSDVEEFDMTFESDDVKANRVRRNAGGDDEKAKADRLDDLLTDVEVLGAQYRDTWASDERTTDIRQFANRCWMELDQDTQTVLGFANVFWDLRDVKDFTAEIDLLNFGHRMYYMVSDVQGEASEVKVGQETGNALVYNSKTPTFSQAPKNKPAKVSASRAQKRKEPATQAASTKTTETEDSPAKRQRVESQKTAGKETNSDKRVQRTENTPAKTATVAKESERPRKTARPHTSSKPAVEATERVQKATKPHKPAAPVAQEPEPPRKAVKLHAPAAPAAPAVKKSGREQESINPERHTALSAQGREHPQKAMNPHVREASVSKATERKQASIMRQALALSNKQLKVSNPSNIKPHYWVTRPPTTKESETKKPHLAPKSSLSRETGAKKPEYNKPRQEKLETRGLDPKKIESEKSKSAKAETAKQVPIEQHKKADIQAPPSAKPTPPAPMKKPNPLRRTVKRPPIIMRPIPKPKK